MSSNSTIEWTDATWNPVRGCTKISPGCKHCYAETFAERFRGVKGHPYEQGFDMRLVPENLAEPLRWRAPKMIFVNSMSDLFHAGVPDAYIDGVFERMEQIDRHVYQLLTKRPERMRRYVQRRYDGGPLPRQIWLGVSVENNDYAWRANMLGSMPTQVRFLSVEPMIGPIDKVELGGISWVIVGGESGARHRPMNIEWVREVRDRCLKMKIPFFFKQWHKRDTGRVLDGRTWDGQPSLFA